MPYADCWSDLNEQDADGKTSDQNLIPKSEQIGVLKDWDDIQAPHQRNELTTNVPKNLNYWIFFIMREWAASR